MGKIILLIFTATFFGGVGQVLFKKSVDTIQKPDLRAPGSYLKFTKSMLTKYLIWAGMFFLVIRTLFWLAALAQSVLSVSYSIYSVQFIVVLVMSHFLLGEKIDKYKLIGTLLVVAGVILVTLK